MAVKGLAELNKALMTLETDVATKIGQSADRAGAVLLAKNIAAAAPVSDVADGTPEMRRGKQTTHHKIKNSIVVKKTYNASPTKVQTTVGVGKAYQASFVEFGSIHNAPNPFMRRATEASTGQIMEAIAKVLQRRLAKQGAI